MLYEDRGAMTATSYAQKARGMMLKKVNQISPIMIYRLPRAHQYTISAVLFAAFWFGFGFVIVNSYFNCTEANGCRSCAVVDTDIEGECEPLSAASLTMSGGCSGLTVRNIYDDIAAVIEYDPFDGKSDLVLQGLSPVFADSYAKHKLIWGCFSQEKRGQVTSPNWECVYDWWKEYYMVQSIMYGLLFFKLTVYSDITALGVWRSAARPPSQERCRPR